MNPSFFRSLIKRVEIALRKAFIAILALRTTQKITRYPLSLPEAPTILFLRQDRIGDAIISTPLLVETKRHFPKAHIIVILGENNKSIVPLLPIDCEIQIYKKNLWQDLNMLHSLRERKIDVAIDLMDNPSVTSSAIISLIGAAYSIGVEKDNSAVYSVTVPQFDHHSTHITNRIVELLRPLGIDPAAVPLQPILKKPTSTTIEGRVGLNLSAGSSNRELTTKTNAEICIGLLQGRYAKEVLLLYHPKDVQRAQAVASLSADKRVIVAPLTKSLVELAEQVATCERLITPDTSIVHIAAAYSIPLVAIYIEATMHNFHYWTPVGVPYEMIVYPQTFEHVRSDEVLDAYKKLVRQIETGTKIITTVRAADHVA